MTESHDRLSVLLSLLRRLTIVILPQLLLPHTALAQFKQDGPKLVGTGATGAIGAAQGSAVATSADGQTAIVGGPHNGCNIDEQKCAIAAWVFAREGDVWSQQGPLLRGTGAAVETGFYGVSVALSADGNTAAFGVPGDDCNPSQNNECVGAVWIFTRSGGAWSQQGPKLVGTGMTNGVADVGASVALSADGNTVIAGGPADGAAWVFIRRNGAWSQQGEKLVFGGTSVAISDDGATALSGGGEIWAFTRSKGVWTQQGSPLVGTLHGRPETRAGQGTSVALSAHGNVAIDGGPAVPANSSRVGDAWVFTRNNGRWTQQGEPLAGTGNDAGSEGQSVSLSADGSTAIVGGPATNFNIGATWVFTRSGDVWTQQGDNLVARGVKGTEARQGQAVALSGDGDTAIVGGPYDNSVVGAAWIFTQPLAVSPYQAGAAAGKAGAFAPSSFSYRLRATRDTVDYTVTSLPKWLTASSTSGALTTTGRTITLTINDEAKKLGAGTHRGVVAFNNTTPRPQGDHNGLQKSILRDVTLTVQP